MSVKGSVRVSPDGKVYAMCASDTAGPTSGKWLLSKPNEGSFWALDSHVAGWKSLFVPQLPVGTILYRVDKSEQLYGLDDEIEFTVAILTDEGWIVVERDGVSSEGAAELSVSTDSGWQSLPVLTG